MNMPPYRHAIIGTGRPLGTEGATGYGMAHHHHRGFQATGRVALSAIADVDEGHAWAFRAVHPLSLPISQDYRELLRTEKPDVVSITVWPHLHAEMTVAACE